MPVLRPSQPRVELKRWAVAAACVAGALALRAALTPLLGERAPFLAFAPAAMLAAWYGGFWPGLVVAVAGALLTDWLFMRPLGVREPTEVTLLAGYLVTSLIGVIACGTLHRSRDRLRALADQRQRQRAALETELEQRRRAEDAAHDSERRLRLLTDSVPALVCYLDHDLIYRFANRTYTEWFGVGLDQIVGRAVPEVIGETAFERIEPFLRRALAGETLDYELQMPYVDGGHRFIHAHYVPHFDDARSHVQGIYIMVQDLTARKRAEDALKHSEQRFAAFMNNLAGAAWMKDLGGRYVYANAEALRIFERRLDDLLGRTDEEVFPPRTATHFRENDRRVIEQGKSITTVEVLRQPDGVDHRSLVSKFVVPGPDGRALYVGGVAIDITSRLAAEQALRDSEQRYRFLAESIPQIVFTARPDGVVNYYNQKLLEYVGATREQLRALGWIHFRHPDDRDQATRRWNHAIATGEPYECTYRMRRGSDGSWRWHLARAIPMRNESGQIVMWFGTCTDVDDQKRAQDALVESEQEFRAVFELSGSGKAMVEPTQGRFVRVNRKLCEMLGYTSDELLERTFTEITHPDDREWTTREASRLMRGEIPVYTAEKRYLRKDGGVIWVQVIATLIRDRQGRPLRAAGVIQDITERKRAEQELRHSEWVLARAQQIAHLGSWEVDLDGRCVRWSDEMYRIFGVSRETFVPTIENILEFVPPEEHEAIRDAGRRAVEQRSGFQIDHRLLLRDGTVRHVSEQAEVIFDDREGGRPLRFIGTTLDITERVRHAEELAAANRAKDQFLAMLSHELRTPLTPVVLALDALRRDASLPDPVREDLDMIRRNVGLEAKLIDDLLDLTRVARGKLELRREPIDVHAALAHAVRSCCSTPDALEKQLTVRLELSASSYTVSADPARLEQVFFNLLRNAVKFTPAGGCITVHTFEPQAGAPPRTLRVEIRDSGVGIEPDVLPRLFNAFEQGARAVTRHFGGLGLGLAICKAIVELHGGSIAAHSGGLNRGATFTIDLPLIEADLPEPLSHPASDAARPASAGRDGRNITSDDDTKGTPVPKPRILLVEDHPTTAAMMLRLFQRLNYDIHSAGDLATARALAERQQFDLVISDLGLPDGSGLDLMRDLRQRYGLRGVALSGFGMDEDLAASKAAGFVEHLVKPISFDALETTVQRLLRHTGPEDAAPAAPVAPAAAAGLQGADERDDGAGE